MSGTLEPGRALGRYRILRVLGSGAMGDVYLAEDPQIERQLAIKTVRVADGKPEDVEDRKRRLLREAKAAGRLVHPHIVTLFDAGEADGVLYLAFEYVAGSDLAKRIETPPPLTLGEVLRIVREAADALGAAHQQGIVHRDVKPSNLLLDARGRVKVADFGIAKVVGQATELTMTGSVVGSPHYLSPEQVRGEELDGRTDIFSLGVVLYELLGHHRPFGGETLTTLVYQILHLDPAPIATLRPDLAPRMEQLLRRMLAKDREQRFPDAASLVSEIATLERSLPSEALASVAAGDEGLDKTHRMPSTGGGATAGVRAATGPTMIANAPTSVSGALVQPAVPSTAQQPAPSPAVPPLPSAAPADPGFVPAPVARKSPLPWILLGLAVVLALLAGAGYVAWRTFMKPAVPPSTQQADANPTPGPGTTSPAPSPAPASPSSPQSNPAPQKPVTAQPTTPNTTPPSTAPANPNPASPGPSTPTRPATPVPSNPSEPPPTAPQAPRPTPVPVRPAPSTPSEERELAPVTPALPAGTRDWNSGLSLSFNVKPDDLVVRYKEISEERGTVIGTVGEHTGKKDAPAFGLPGPGEYLVTLVRNGETVANYLVHARSGGPSAPLTFDANAPRPSSSPANTGGARTVKERLVLQVDPKSATIYVDGRAVGSAKDFSGGFTGSKVLQLAPGAHKLRIEAAGFRSVEYSLQVIASTDKDTIRLDMEHE